MHQPPSHTAAAQQPLSSKLQQMMDGCLLNCVGKTFTVRFLTSEKGKALNDQLCTAFGHNGERLQVMMKGTGECHLLKMANLLPEGAE